MKLERVWAQTQKGWQWRHKLWMRGGENIHKYWCSQTVNLKPQIYKIWRGKGGSAYNGLWAMEISKDKGELKPAQVQAMAEHTLQNTTRGGEGCGTYAISRVLYEEMMESTRSRWYWRPPNIKQRASQYTFFNFKLLTVTSKQAMVNAKGFEEDPLETEGLVCSLSTFRSIPPSPY